MSESLIFAHFLFFGERCERFAHDCSGCSPEMSNVSDHERIAQVAHQKWANRLENRWATFHPWVYVWSVTYSYKWATASQNEPLSYVSTSSGFNYDGRSSTRTQDLRPSSSLHVTNAQAFTWLLCISISGWTSEWHWKIRHCRTVKKIFVKIKNQCVSFPTKSALHFWNLRSILNCNSFFNGYHNC